MPNVAILDTPFARAARAHLPHRKPETFGIFDVARRLGQDHRRPRYICATIDALIAGAGFPKPYPLARAGRLVAGVHQDSRFPLAAVDDWFDNQSPPTGPGVGTAERVEVDSRLNSNLAHLFEDTAA